mmetsp:Transcript_7032/g.18369  ORF Transcript_7032/g.18369 Transcript_7032/m.18369 type:complete len:207 (-) Transcript_7032:297-917(-)
MVKTSVLGGPYSPANWPISCRYSIPSLGRYVPSRSRSVCACRSIVRRSSPPRMCPGGPRAPRSLVAGMKNARAVNREGRLEPCSHSGLSLLMPRVSLSEVFIGTCSYLRNATSMDSLMARSPLAWYSSHSPVFWSHAISVVGRPKRFILAPTCRSQHCRCGSSRESACWLSENFSCRWHSSTFVSLRTVGRKLSVLELNCMSGERK